MTDLAARTQCKYSRGLPLAPEHPYPEAIEALYDVYQALLVQGIQPKDILYRVTHAGPISFSTLLALKRTT